MSGGACGSKELLVYVAWGGSLEDRVSGGISYKRESNRCIWNVENINADGVKKLVGRTMGKGQGDGSCGIL